MEIYNDNIVGLRPLVSEIEYDCIKYKGCNSCVKPNSIILNLDSGEGRTMITEYISDMFCENEVLDFSTSIYDYFEMDFSGDPKNMRDLFLEYDTILPTFSNEYNLVLSVTLDKLALRFHETGLINSFVRKIKEVSKNAFIIFFVSSNITKNERELINLIMEETKNVKEITLPGYSNEELLNIFYMKLNNMGFSITDDNEMNPLILDVISKRGICTVKELNKLIDEILMKSNVMLQNKVICFNDLFTLFKEEMSGDKYVKL